MRATMSLCGVKYFDVSVFQVALVETRGIIDFITLETAADNQIAQVADQASCQPV